MRGLTDRLNVAKPAITWALDRLEQFDLARHVNESRERHSVLVTRMAVSAAHMAALRALMQASARGHGTELRTTPARAVE